MPFIGQEPQVGAYHVLDSITASATATYNLQLSGAAFSPASANHLLVSLNGVLQKPGASFNVSGSQITFSSALTSSDNINFIMALGNVLDVGTPTDGTITSAKMAPNVIGEGITVNTGDPAYNTNLAGKSVGHFWVNSTSGEVYILTNATTNANVWTNVGDGTGRIDNSYLISDILVVAGGGGGGARGGGGAGGMIQQAGFSISVGNVITATVGAGGAGGTTGDGGDGGNSVLSTNDSVNPFSTQTAIGGGGGGKSAAGSNGVGNSRGGNGGAGLADSITGSSVTYAGGGGGGSETVVGGDGGAGGGGRGAFNGNYAANAGTANTGGGGGGAYNASWVGGAGGSGVVIIVVPTARYSGTTTGSPTVTTVGDNKVIKFTSSGTYTA